MIRTFDGNSFKRVGGKPGDRSPAVGFTRLRVVYTATGGETSVSLTGINSQFTYTPGSAQISVKRSSGGSLIAGLDFFETSTSTIGFPSADPLIAGEIVEVTREVSVTGIQALQARPDGYQAVGTAGQTGITANFSWPYAMSPAGVRVYVHGIRLTRNVDFFEVNLSSANTNQITLADPLVGGENILMEPTYAPIDQTSATSTFNSTQLSNIQSWLTSGAQGWIDTTSLITAPTTTIVNRAKIPDISNDLKPSMGSERIMTQQIYQIANESGANGEEVWGAVNDDRGLIRFVGGGWVQNGLIVGPEIFTSTVNDYVEITFYGTGLNLLDQIDGGARDYRVSVDGGAETSAALTGSAVLNNRNYSMNVVRNMASGLSLGIHTVKIRLQAVGLSVYGFEILNNSTSINVNPGFGYINGQKYSSLAASSLAYNSTFESGTLGTRGGRVVIYQKADGTIAKAVTPTNASSATFTSSDHSNEDLARTYHWREFGSNRADDFSTLGSGAANKAFTLDDGVTTLSAINGIVDPNIGEALAVTSGTSNLSTFTFVGTGLDVQLQQSANGFARSMNFTIDGGASVGTVSYSTAQAPTWVKVVSGLPYGTHTVKFVNGSGTLNAPGIVRLNVYQPKKPSVPSGAIELADYNVVANYDGTTAVSTTDHSIFPTGVITKTSLREMQYVGSWSITTGRTENPYQVFASSTTVGDSFTYTFFGTGFELEMYTQSAGLWTVSATIDGSLNSTGVARSNMSNAGSGNYSSTSTTASLPARVEFTGLSLGFHTVKIALVSGSTISLTAFHTITPVHSIKTNFNGDYQNTLSVGSTAISDNRKTTPSKDAIPSTKAWAQAMAVTSDPTTSSTVYVPMPEMSTSIKVTGTSIRVTGYASMKSNGSNGVDMAVYVDGVQTFAMAGVTATLAACASFTDLIPVSPGYHKVDLYWRSPGGTTLTSGGLSRILTVEER